MPVYLGGLRVGASPRAGDYRGVLEAPDGHQILGPELVLDVQVRVQEHLPAVRHGRCRVEQVEHQLPQVGADVFVGRPLQPGQVQPRGHLRRQRVGQQRRRVLRDVGDHLEEPVIRVPESLNLGLLAVRVSTRLRVSGGTACIVVICHGQGP